MLKLKLTGWILGNVIHIVCNWSICKLGKMMINTFICHLKPHYYQRSNAWCGTSMTSAKIWQNRLIRFSLPRKVYFESGLMEKGLKKSWNYVSYRIQMFLKYLWYHNTKKYMYVCIYTHTAMAKNIGTHGKYDQRWQWKLICIVNPFDLLFNKFTKNLTFHWIIII